MSQHDTANENKSVGDVAQMREQHPLALAFVNGEAIIEKPEDLYIPPDALEVILESFAGPLDLLLYLIRRQKFTQIFPEPLLVTPSCIAGLERQSVGKKEIF